MATDHRSALASIKRFDQLIKYLRDEMGWPIAQDSFEDVDDLFYDFTADELGIDPKTAAKIQEIKRLRPLSPKQPWGIFFIKFEPKRLPVVALRRILGQVALKKRASSNSAEHAAWAADDLLFVSNYGEGDERQISFAYFARVQDGHDLPTLKVLGWDNRDTALHLDAVARELTTHLTWPDNDTNVEAWRTRWRAAFTLGHREVVTTSKELSIRLAELAGAIRNRIKTALAIETDKGPLTRLMKAFQTALVHDLDADGFADMYAQTIAYGLLSARIADPHKKTADDFAAHMRTNPFLRELMETFLKVGGRHGKAGGSGIDFDELGVSEVVELLDAANMEAVVRDFDDRNPQEDPVIHFYELFLEEYDAKTRMRRGVFYTPRPVVSYIVRSVDERLRSEFGLEDGLADVSSWRDVATRNKSITIPAGVAPDQDFVQVLDPATGTGTFLVEAIDLIHKTLLAKWRAQRRSDKEVCDLWNEYVPKHLLRRLHGYELLMAPYAIAHLKVGLKLYETGYRFGSAERARIYLTNALEPWVRQLPIVGLDALAHEAAAVNEMKRTARYTVVMGNPPYSNVGRLNRNTFILALLDDYKRGLKERKLNLDDDYIKFIRFAENCVESSGLGIVGVISNSSYLDGATHRAMRRHLLRTFSRLDIVNLHGNVRRKEAAPDGGRDENVFDIIQGVAISIGSKSPSPADPSFSYADVWGLRTTKLTRLIEGIEGRRYDALGNDPQLCLFVPRWQESAPEYLAWPSISEILSLIGQGIQTKQDRFCIALSKKEMRERVGMLTSASHAKIKERYDLEGETPSWSLKRAIADVQEKSGRLIRIGVRPFDERWTFYTGTTNGFHSRPRRASTDNMLSGNVAIVAKRQCKEELFNSAWVTAIPINEGFFSIDPRGRETLFPLMVHDQETSQLSLGDAGHDGEWFNVDTAKFAHFGGVATPASVFAYVYAVLSSTKYRTRYGAYLKADFPRIPTTVEPNVFTQLAQYGRQLITCHTALSFDGESATSLLAEAKAPGEVVGKVVGAIRGIINNKAIRWEQDALWLSDEIRIDGVSAAIWGYEVGGYRLCERWLRGRASAPMTLRMLDEFRGIMAAIRRTLQVVEEIDAALPVSGYVSDRKSVETA